MHVANTTTTDAADAESPLRPAELQVLRAQYEKEGDYVGVQTKFNFAWVGTSPIRSLSPSGHKHASANPHSRAS